MAGLKTYTAQFWMKGFDAEAALDIGDTALSVTGGGAQRVLPYCSIDSFYIENFRVKFDTELGRADASRMGHDLDDFMHELSLAYNDLVAQALFISGEPLMRTYGEYSYNDDGGPSSGEAEFRIYPECVTILPAGSAGRRIPLCFVTGIARSGYRLTLTLDTGEHYEFIRLGRDTDHFEYTIKDCIAAIKSNAANFARSLDTSLSSSQTAAIAALIPEGAAAPMGALRAISPSFAYALEEMLKESRTAETYQYLKTISDPDSMIIGAKSGLGGTDERNAMLWFAAPSRKNAACAVELALGADDSAATFIYSCNAPWQDFSRRLNHAMEAIDFHREVITYAAGSGKTHYDMAIKRTAALRLLRSSLSGRAIHSTIEAWQREIDRHL